MRIFEASQMCSTALDAAQYGADEDGKDEGKAAMHAAAEEGNIDVVKSLLERGLDVNGHDARYEAPLHRMERKGNLDAISLLVERSAKVDSHNKWGWTSLHLASR